MEGAYPTDIKDALRSLRNENVAIGPLRSDQDIVEAPLELRTGIEAMTLPEPHPLDYDWRFAEQSLTFLVCKITDSRSKRIAILGAPRQYFFAWLGVKRT